MTCPQETPHEETNIAAAERIWLGPAGPGPQTRLFRKTIRTDEMPRSVRLELYAETVYHLWVNGQYVQRGPTFHHAHRRPVTVIDLASYWHAGANTLAVLVYARNMPTHNNIPSGDVGLSAAIVIEGAHGVTRHVTDASWRATDRTGWQETGPKRNWALGPLEVFDAGEHPLGWQRPDFDDSAWATAEVCPAWGIAGSCWLAPALPLLRDEWVSPVRLGELQAAEAQRYTPNTEDGGGKYADFLTGQPWHAAASERTEGTLDSADGLAVTGLDSERDVMLWGDLGQLYAGQVMLECECQSDGVIDICWSETLADGLPELVRKGTPYADRIVARAGRVLWQPIGFTSAQYVAVIFRGFEGSVRVRRFGMLASEPDLDWGGHFECDDERLNAIWRICERTIRVGTQEAMMDCPSREQASYLGDGFPVARWVAELTGDLSHWRHLVREGFARQAPTGLMRSTVFTALKRWLMDYSLLAIIGTRDFLRAGGDEQTVRDVLDNCRAALGWFRGRKGDDGLLHIGAAMLGQPHESETQFDPEHWYEDWCHMLFIDHPGLGWHNKEEPGIDRSGINAAINALYVQALDATAELEDACGESGEALRAEADELRRAAVGAFYVPEQHAFADGQDNGRPLAQISQQTNTWCIEAGMLDAAGARETIDRIGRRDDAELARSGPYFWYYMFAMLARHGRCAEALEEVRRLWGPMVDAGSTTVWETFAGDWLDTWCHPWSCAPVGFLLNEVLGLDPVKLLGDAPAIRPRTDLLGSASGRVMLPGGPVEVSWRRDAAGTVTLTGKLPEGITAALHAPDGSKLAEVSGRWQYEG